MSHTMRRMAHASVNAPRVRAPLGLSDISRLWRLFHHQQPDPPPRCDLHDHERHILPDELHHHCHRVLVDHLIRLVRHRHRLRVEHLRRVVRERCRRLLPGSCHLRSIDHIGLVVLHCLLVVSDLRMSFRILTFLFSPSVSPASIIFSPCLFPSFLHLAIFIFHLIPFSFYLAFSCLFSAFLGLQAR